MKQLIFNISGMVILLFHPSTLAEDNIKFEPSRDAYGHPDLQGNWTNRLATPFERPNNLGEQATYSQEEANQLKQSLIEDVSLKAAPIDPNRAAPDSADGVDQSSEDIFTPEITELLMIEGEYRTSIITDPSNGRLPRQTTWMMNDHYGQLRKLATGNADGPELRPPSERCLSVWGPMPPLGGRPLELPNYKIVQTPTHIVFYQELGGTSRIIKMNGNKFPEIIPQWQGDSIGYWDNDTLFVETDNINPLESTFSVPLSKEYSVKEEFKLVSNNEILYKFTVEDPVIYTSSFSGEVILSRMPQGDKIYEYACHEGNYAFPGILAGARRQEMENKLEEESSK